MHVSKQSRGDHGEESEVGKVKPKRPKREADEVDNAFTKVAQSEDSISCAKIHKVKGNEDRTLRRIR